MFFSTEVFYSNNKLLSFTRSVLEHYGLKPRRRLGQNFTVAIKYLNTFHKQIVEATDESKDILEVGTGIGTLTFYIAGKNPDKNVITIEKDKRLFNIAMELAGLKENIVFIYGDALEIIELTHIPTLISSTPFNISTPLLISICRNNNIRRAVLGLQDEVARRIESKPGTKTYGRLTVLVKLLFQTKLLGRFPPSSFYPRPEVQTSIILLERKEMYEEKIHRTLEKLTGCLFSQRNKLVKKAVRHCIDKIGFGEGLLDSMEQIRGEKRVRDLSPRDFLEMAKKII